MGTKWIKLFLRFALGISFLSAVADRFGLWAKDISAWGNWSSFLEYTSVINPWFPEATIPALGSSATAAELVFGICLLIGFKTEFIAKMSGYLLLIFALSITFASGIKGAFDYSVFTASAAAFALGLMKEKHWELDTLISKSTN